MVMVSHEKQFAFLKTRKTAGTTIEMVLEPACAPEGHVVTEATPALVSPRGIVGSRLTPRRRPRWLYWRSNRWRNHASASDVRRYLGGAVFDRYRKVTAVRNPFDRCVSYFHWRYKKKGREAELAEADFAEIRAAFRAYIASERWPDDRCAAFVGDRYVIDHAIRFEHLVDDLRAVAADLGVAVPDTALPHTKSTSQSRKTYPIPEYYDAASIDIVRRRFSWIFERFDYADTPVCVSKGADDD